MTYTDNNETVRAHTRSQKDRKKTDLDTYVTGGAMEPETAIMASKTYNGQQRLSRTLENIYQKISTKKQQHTVTLVCTKWAIQGRLNENSNSFQENSKYLQSYLLMEKHRKHIQQWCYLYLRKREFLFYESC